MATVDDILGPPSVDDLLGPPPKTEGDGREQALREYEGQLQGAGNKFSAEMKYGAGGTMDEAISTLLNGVAAIMPPQAGIGDINFKNKLTEWASSRKAEAPQREAERTTELQAAGGEKGSVGSMIGGAAPAVAAGAAAGPGIAANAIVGGITSALTTPSKQNDPNYWANKGVDLLTGAGFGAAGAAVTRWVAGTLTNKNPAAIKILEDSGVDNLTGGMRTGGMRNTLEQAAESYPIGGGRVSARRQDVVEAVNREALNMPLKVIGAPLLTKTDKIGNEGYKRVVEATEGYYDNLVTRLTSPWDADLTATISAAKNKLSSAPADIKGQFDKIIDRELVKRFDYGAGVFHGPDLKTAQGELRAAVQDWKGTGWNRELSNALRDVEVDLRNMVGRNNPQALNELNKANLAWAMMKRIEPAVIAAKDSGGVFTPHQLTTSVTRGAARYSKEMAAKGEGLIQPYAQAASQVVGNRLGRSGTAERVAMAGAIAGIGSLGASALGLPASEYTGPIGAGALGAGLGLGALYTRPGMRAVAAAARRPGAVAVPAGAIGASMMGSQ